jgi:RNA 2',3'-cyclic 3'-phosphodiesterase
LRTFLSYDITDPSVLARITQLQAGLRATGADLKPVDPSILHFTVRFLGEISEDQISEIVKALQEKVENFSPSEAKFKGVGTFPSEQRISVIWIGCDEYSGKALSERARTVNENLEKLLSGSSRENFSPHLTVARVKSARNKEKLLDFIASHKNDEFGAANIGRLKLKLSELSPSGPKYSDLHVFE